MWGPNIIFSMFGLAGLWAVRRESGTAHGGDWADLRDLLIGWIPGVGRTR
jgi:hypothetical protein